MIMLGIKGIFKEYISERTLLQIGNTLTEEKVVYYRDRTLWSKQAIRRIIENKHYVGDESYPAIIDREMFEKANLLRLGKGGDREKDSEGIQKKFISSRKRQRTLRKSFRCTCRGEALIK